MDDGLQIVAATLPSRRVHRAACISTLFFTRRRTTFRLPARYGIRHVDRIIEHRPPALGLQCRRPRPSARQGGHCALITAARLSIVTHFQVIDQRIKVTSNPCLCLKSACSSFSPCFRLTPPSQPGMLLRKRQRAPSFLHQVRILHRLRHDCHHRDPHHPAKIMLVVF
jgi:hypothetical protein